MSYLLYEQGIPNDFHCMVVGCFSILKKLFSFKDMEPQLGYLFHIIPETSKTWSLSLNITPSEIPSNTDKLNIIQLLRNETNGKEIDVISIFQSQGLFSLITSLFSP